MHILEKIYTLNKENASFVVVSVVKTAGSTPGKTGFKMIVQQNGITAGTVGGGAIEVEAANEAIKRMSENNSGLSEYILSDKMNESLPGAKIVPMSCNGRIWLYYEVFNSSPSVYIFGGGHVGQALLKILSILPYRGILVDNREEFANDTINGAAFEINLSEYEDFAASFNPQPGSYAVVLTQQHLYDYQVLKKLLERNLGLNYIGVIASKSKAKGLIEKAISELPEGTDMSHVHSPVGLMIGGDSASEIALTIAAQIQAVRYNKIVTINE